MFPKPIDGVFPKTCNNCGESFDSIDTFYQKTNSLPKDGSICARGKILLLRNCTCGTTLTIKIKELRDLSSAGEEKREWIHSEIERIKSSITDDYQLAKKLALQNFSKKSEV